MCRVAKSPLFSPLIRGLCPTQPRSIEGLRSAPSSFLEHIPISNAALIGQHSSPNSENWPSEHVNVGINIRQRGGQSRMPRFASMAAFETFLRSTEPVRPSVRSQRRRGGGGPNETETEPTATRDGGEKRFKRPHKEDVCKIFIFLIPSHSKT